MTRLSLLDLVPVVEGGTVSQSLANAADLAAHAESLGPLSGSGLHQYDQVVLQARRRDVWACAEKAGR